MLVWRKGNINKTVSAVLQYCVPLLWCTMVPAVLTYRSTGLGFDLVRCSSLSSEHLCIFGLHGAMYNIQHFCCILYFKAERGGIGP